jgi:hypothetical protein
MIVEYIILPDLPIEPIEPEGPGSIDPR